LSVEADGEAAFEALRDALVAHGFASTSITEFATPAAEGAVR
jgi:hypothetical protein